MSAYRKIFGVEGQQLFDVVRFHRGGDFCVVDLDAGDEMFDDEFAPVFIDISCVGQYIENLFDLRELRIGLSNRKT